MFSFLEGLCETGVNVRCEAHDCFHLIDCAPGQLSKSTVAALTNDCHRSDQNSSPF